MPSSAGPLPGLLIRVYFHSDSFRETFQIRLPVYEIVRDQVTMMFSNVLVHPIEYFANKCMIPSKHLNQLNIPCWKCELVQKDQ
jgi:hypothetical protein